MQTDGRCVTITSANHERSTALVADYDIWQGDADGFPALVGADFDPPYQRILWSGGLPMESSTSQCSGSFPLGPVLQEG